MDERVFKRPGHEIKALEKTRGCLKSSQNFSEKIVLLFIIYEGKRDLGKDRKNDIALKCRSIEISAIFLVPWCQTD